MTCKGLHGSFKGMGSASLEGPQGVCRGVCKGFVGVVKDLQESTKVYNTPSVPAAIIMDKTKHSGSHRILASEGQSWHKKGALVADIHQSPSQKIFQPFLKPEPRQTPESLPLNNPSATKIITHPPLNLAQQF